MNDNYLMKNTSIPEMVAQYEAALVEISKGYELLASAKSRLGRMFGHYRNQVIPNNTYHHDDPAKMVEEVRKIMHRNAWKGVTEKSEIKKILSEKRAKELDDMLERGELPELSFDTITQFLDNLRSNAGNYFQEAACEVFDFLRPRRSGYKTNTEYEIKDRAIIECGVDCDKWGFVRMNYYKEQNFIALDNVFHMLDGKGTPKYPGDAVTQIRDAISQNPRKWSCETEYFEFKWHKKGTMHIKFKRMDLVKKLNALAGGNRLRKNAA